MSVIIALCVLVSLASAQPPLCNGGTCPQCLDIVLVIDRSSSVGTRRWEGPFRAFINNFATASSWNIGPNAAQIAVVTYSTTATLNWNWGNAQTQDTALFTTAAATLPYNGGTTNTGEGLRVARETVIQAMPSRDRPDCANYCVVLSNGGTNANFQAAFNAELGPFKAACERVIAVGVTSHVSRAILQSIATEERLVFAVDKFRDLRDITFNALTSAMCAQPPACPTCSDLVFVLDGSSSIGSWRWSTFIRPFLANFANTDKWAIGRGLDAYQIAVVTFSSGGAVQWNWGEIQTIDRANLNQAINELPYPRGFTNTGEGQRLAREQILTDTLRNRPECGDVCIVVTDGRTNDNNMAHFTSENGLFKRSCNRVIAVAVGTDAIQDIASSPQYQVNVARFNDLPAAFVTVADHICDQCP